MNTSLFFTNGYISGNLNDVNIDYSSFLSMCKKVRDKIEHLNENFIRDNRRAIKNYTLKRNDNENVFSYFRDVAYTILNELDASYKCITNDLIVFMDDGCFLSPHRDRISFDGNKLDAVLIIYLSDPAEYNQSGKLVLVGREDEKTIDPVEGNFFIFETKVHNLAHKIEHVTENFKRFTYVAQIQRIL